MSFLRTSPASVSVCCSLSLSFALAACSSGGSFAVDDAGSKGAPHAEAGPDGAHDGATSPLDAKVAPREASTVAADAKGATPDAVAPDAPTKTSKDAASVFDGHVLAFPDAGAAIKACESCLQSTCGADVNECLNDPSCEEAITCTITSGCLAVDAGGVEACVNSCIKSEGLSHQQTAQLVQEITMLSTCASSCTTTCAVADAGAH